MLAKRGQVALDIYCGEAAECLNNETSQESLFSLPQANRQPLARKISMMTREATKLLEDCVSKDILNDYRILTLDITSDRYFLLYYQQNHVMLKNREIIDIL